MKNAPLLNPALSTPSGAILEGVSGGEADVDASVGEILAVLRRGHRFLVSSHTRPDGDAMGSMLAMGMLLRAMGKQVDLVTADGVPATYRGLPGAGLVDHVCHIHGHYDAVILLECDSIERSRLQGLEDYFLINIDHHVSGRNFAQLNWIDCRVASVGELVFRLVEAAGVSLTPEMATCLYATVLTDTGGFRWGSVSASTFALAQRLVEAGAEPVKIAAQLCFSVPLAKMLLIGDALHTLQREGALAWFWISDREIQCAHATEEDSEGIVNMALAIAGVEVAVFLRELPEGNFRLSLRSKGKIDVAAIAERVGGGGHVTAAGCTLDGPLDAALEKILAEVRATMTC